MIYIIFGVNLAVLWKYLFFLPLSILYFNPFVFCSAITEILATGITLFAVSNVGSTISNIRKKAMITYIITILLNCLFLLFGYFSVSIIIILFICIVNMVFLNTLKNIYLTLAQSIIPNIALPFFICSGIYVLILAPVAIHNMIFYYYVISLLIFYAIFHFRYKK